MTQEQLIIGGQKRNAAETFSVINPYDGSTVAEVGLASASDVIDAVEAAKEGQKEIAQLPAYEKADLLLSLTCALLDNKNRLAETITAESGKPVQYSLMEVDRAIETFRFSSEEAKMIHGQTLPMSAARGGENRSAFFERFPIGPVAAITPFNFPLNLVAHKWGPAIAAGNAFVLKPAEQTPLTSLRLAELLLDIGMPAKAVNVIPGAAETGACLVTQDDIKMISFTGSPQVGRHIKKNAGLKRVTLELGSNSGVIIEPDTDIESVIDRCLHGSFYNSGQVCISLQRIYLHEDIYDEFKELLINEIQTLKLGDPFDIETDIGPLIDQGAADRTTEWIEEAIASGAHLVCGGKVHPHNILEPTVIENVQSDLKVVCNEIFAPVATLIPYTDFDNALLALNDSIYGLHAGIFTKDIDKAFRAFRTLDVGGVIINDIPTYRSDHMPYGGVKESGLGREGVKYAIEEMTEIKTMVFNL